MSRSWYLLTLLAPCPERAHAHVPYTGVRAEYAPASMSSMRVGPAGVQPRRSRVAVLVAARSMPKKVRLGEYNG